jgi:hypothetical protein
MYCVRTLLATFHNAPRDRFEIATHSRSEDTAAARNLPRLACGRVIIALGSFFPEGYSATSPSSRSFTNTPS